MPRQSQNHKCKDGQCPYLAFMVTQGQDPRGEALSAQNGGSSWNPKYYGLTRLANLGRAKTGGRK